MKKKILEMINALDFKKNSKGVLVGLFLLNTFFLMFFLYNYYNAPTKIGGVLRPNAEGEWYILDHKGHESVKLSHITQKDTSLTLHYSTKLNKIHWVAVTPDDTLALNDIDVGASVSRNEMQIFFSKNGTLIKPSELQSINSAVWVYVEGR